MTKTPSEEKALQERKEREKREKEERRKQQILNLARKGKLPPGMEVPGGATTNDDEEDDDNEEVEGEEEDHELEDESEDDDGDEEEEDEDHDAEIETMKKKKKPASKDRPNKRATGAAVGNKKVTGKRKLEETGDNHHQQAEARSSLTTTTTATTRPGVRGKKPKFSAKIAVSKEFKKEIAGKGKWEMLICKHTYHQIGLHAKNKTKIFCWFAITPDIKVIAC